MSLKRDFENAFDDLCKPCKMIRKIVIEQFLGHAGIFGALGFLAANWLPLPSVLQATVAVLVAVLLGVAREIYQNWGDPRERNTLFVLPLGPGVPVNFDMMLDVFFYSVGGGVAGWLVQL